MLSEVRPDIRYGTHVVVSSRFYKDGNAVRTITFVVDLLIAFGRLICRFLDSAVDILLGHILALALLNKHSQTRVAIGICTALTSSDSDFFT